MQNNENPRIRLLRELYQQVEKIHQLSEEGDWQEVAQANARFHSSLEQLFLQWDREQPLSPQEQKQFESIESLYQQAVAIQTQRKTTLTGEMGGLIRGRQGIKQYKNCLT